MATKQRHEEQKSASSRTTLLLLSVGGLAVAALVVWALTRTVETPPAVAATSETPLSTPSTATPPPNMPLSATASFPQTQTPAAPEESTASVPRIAVEDLREKMRTGAVTVIDVRDDTSFINSHIPGALHIPLARIEGEMSTLPKDKPIVTYCT